MTLICLIQRTSILAGMTLASLSIPSSPAQAEITEFCIIASNGKTVCGKARGIERMCITTDGSNILCGKFKSAKEGQEQGQEARQPLQGIVARKEVDNFVFALKGCRKSESSVKCDLIITNKGRERSIVFDARESKLVDLSGKSHQGTAVDLGERSDSAVSGNMTPGIDYSASVTFENIPIQLAKAQLLNLYFSGFKPVQFRNIPISN